MKYFWCLVSLIIILGCKTEVAKNVNETNKTEHMYNTIGKIIKLDPALDNIIDPTSKIEILDSGFVWSEGPLWIDEEGGYLLFSDIPPNSIYKWKEGEGTSLYLKPSGYTGEKERGGEPGSNGLILDSEGNLVLCQHGDRQMAKMDAPLSAPKAKFVTLTDNWDGKKLNSPNDAVFHSNGDLYFTDPPYGLVGNMNDPAKEIPFQGVYRLDQNGNTHLLIDSITRPNGLAFSPDEKILYIASSDPDHPIILSYSLTEEGNLENGKILIDTKSLMINGNKGLPDGMKVRSDGTIFATGPGGILILTQEGKHLGTIHSGEATSNCAFDKDENYIYGTSDMYLIRVKLK